MITLVLCARVAPPGSVKGFEYQFCLPLIAVPTRGSSSTVVLQRKRRRRGKEEYGYHSPQYQVTANQESRGWWRGPVIRRRGGLAQWTA
ncbi:hypothetical protein O3P69_015701 [Scylla paramamosain]|uniref:Secreted protein n=1 Tax=Scylla paramamosain TaxID=85552 RepID=A0AAW0SA92_SCYPA